MVINNIKQDIAKRLSIENSHLDEEILISLITYRPAKPYRGHKSISPFGLVINLDQAHACLEHLRE